MSKLTKHNKEVFRASLEESIERFTYYVEHHCMSREEAQELFDAGEKHKIDFKALEYTNYLALAKHLKENIDSIAVHVHEACYNIDRLEVKVFPNEMLKSLYEYRRYCYKNRTSEPAVNFSTLDEQNKETKEYVHYDFSVKRIKVLTNL